MECLKLGQEGWDGEKEGMGEVRYWKGKRWSERERKKERDRAGIGRRAMAERERKRRRESRIGGREFVLLVTGFWRRYIWFGNKSCTSQGEKKRMRKSLTLPRRTIILCTLASREIWGFQRRDTWMGNKIRKRDTHMTEKTNAHTGFPYFRAIF